MRSPATHSIVKNAQIVTLVPVLSPVFDTCFVVAYILYLLRILTIYFLLFYIFCYSIYHHRDLIVKKILKTRIDKNYEENACFHCPPYFMHPMTESRAEIFESDTRTKRRGTFPNAGSSSNFKLTQLCLLYTSDAADE